jgi:hypothetical protein
VTQERLATTSQQCEHEVKVIYLINKTGRLYELLNFSEPKMQPPCGDAT